MTLNAEVMREYDQGFVYPKLFATRMDKSVQTNEGECNRTNLWIVLISLTFPQPRCCIESSCSRPSVSFQRS